MIGSFLSIIGVLFLWLISPEAIGALKLRSVFVFGGALFLVICLVSMLHVLRSLQKNQYKVIGLGQALFGKDLSLLSTLAFLFAFFLFSIFLTILPQNLWLFSGWIIGLGVSFDLLRFYIRRSYNYISLPFLLKKIEKKMDKSIRKGDENAAIDTISTVIEATSLAITKNRLRAATTALNSIQNLIEVYVKELARIELLNPPALEPEGPSFLDKVNYLCIFVCERLQWMHESAIRNHMRPIAIEIISEFGKLSLFFSKHNTSLASLPLTFLLKCAREAQSKEEQEIVVRSSFALCETCKAFIQLSLEKGVSSKELIFDCIARMEEIAQMMYRQNQEINPALLMQPFAEVAQMLGLERMKNCPDREEILNELKRVLIQFQSLQMMMPRSEEAIDVVQDTSSSFQQDIPFMS